MSTKTLGNGIDLAGPNGAAELQARLLGRLGRQVRDFKAVVGEKGLILRGQARTYHAKQLAQHVVMEVTSFPIVANEIEVASATEMDRAPSTNSKGEGQ
jgi:hypothetical protein